MPAKTLGVDSPLFSAIVLFKTRHFPRVFGGFLERRIPGKNGEVTPRKTVGRLLDMPSTSLLPFPTQVTEGCTAVASRPSLFSP